MNAPAKLGAYGLGLVVIFSAALGIGNTVGAVGAVGPSPAGDGHGAHAPSLPARPAAESVPAGLQVSQDGYTLTPETTTLAPGERTAFRFTVTGPDGRPVTSYQVAHEKKLHFIVVNRDLGWFQHLHPTEVGGGVWSVPLSLPQAGAYRAFADFVPEGHEGLTLGTDLFAPGDHTPQPLPPATRTAEADGYTVELDGDLTPGTSSRLTLTVSKDGAPVTDLEPYLGAYGHLVALRAGDLAYLHVHPDGEPGDGVTRPGPAITFNAEVPSRGDYRLFLDFQHGGTVHTAAFTLRAVPSPAGATPAGADHEHSGH
ncbi:hypothetical protein GCM10023194_32530 [Planotetraspora phitsanulokensis]|uniref:Secreted protein n=1 Tax=Planotetraspora phitsanulokensis TaxID=575192 RepID=A0A8J3TZF8_9ACTN|nr:hypothetical protein [Planotetraspora phitsanulokensis]GII35608.1 hypothetical protein Pph01_06110 [Planotetraspora phitsanulokensis]